MNSNTGVPSFRSLPRLLVTWFTMAALASSLVVAPAGDAADAENSIFQANQRLGRGVNLGNFLEVPRDQDWGVKIVPDHLATIKQAGFDSIRLPVKWSDYASKVQPYAIEPEFFSRVDRWLDRAEQEKLNVVLNIHHYDQLDTDPDQHVERFRAIWRQIAQRYQSRGPWLYFELDNEPHDKLSSKWNEVLLQGLAAVRESNPTRPVIIGPPNWNGIWALPQLRLPDDPNLIVTVHMYNPHNFTHQGASWSNPEVRSIKDLSWGSKEERAALDKEIQQAADWGKQHSRPIYLGEFGAYSSAPQDSRVRWTRAVVTAAERHQMSWAYWEFGAGFGLYDIQQSQWRQDLLNAVMP
ncbi:glycoside hydrolase family 5 protein [Stieleria varia]|uniref:Endoglucanase H n=1 Tax=Stieleria varia TaxID=2528005 RepID=A0A5C6B8X9_9BACT|nr:glycoside hydrolase family 5 protein [Stieleria varia]TWU08420.1 Endoglucanase H precursor [Stieleria varia]